MEKQNNCPICGREMIEGPSVDDHHLIPKSKGGKYMNVVRIHRICHNKIHSVWTESELAQEFHTVEKIVQNNEIKKFIKWLKKKPADFYTSTRDSNNRKRKRKGKKKG
jgi:5-methylcytosine-specific restriction endonuclease McrA